jgi:hypothetical protein
VELEPNAPTIVESFRDFEPPSNFRRDVETLLRYVPPKYLVGLSTIVLTNCAALTRDKRKRMMREIYESLDDLIRQFRIAGGKLSKDYKIPIAVVTQRKTPRIPAISVVARTRPLPKIAPTIVAAMRN